MSRRIGQYVKRDCLRLRAGLGIKKAVEWRDGAGYGKGEGWGRVWEG